MDVSLLWGYWPFFLSNAVLPNAWVTYWSYNAVCVSYVWIKKLSVSAHPLLCLNGPEYPGFCAWKHHIPIPETGIPVLRKTILQPGVFHKKLGQYGIYPPYTGLWQMLTTCASESSARLCNFCNSLTAVIWGGWRSLLPLLEMRRISHVCNAMSMFNSGKPIIRSIGLIFLTFPNLLQVVL